MTQFDKFLTQVEEMKTNPTDECIEWPHTKNKAGYGIVYSPVKGRNVFVHREVLEQIDGAEPELACHVCRNRACYNYHHLYDGSASDNASDRIIMERLGNGGEKLTVGEIAAVTSAVKARRHPISHDERKKRIKELRRLASRYGIARMALEHAYIKPRYLTDFIDYIPEELEKAIDEVNAAVDRAMAIFDRLPYPREEDIPKE